MRLSPHAIGLALLFPVWASAQDPGSMDLQLGVTTRHTSIEIGTVPFYMESRKERAFAKAKVSVALIKAHDRDREDGIRVHGDALAGGEGWYVHAGTFLTHGEGVGFGVGLRLGGGRQLTPRFRFGLVADAIAGTKASVGSLGIEGGWTF